MVQMLMTNGEKVFVVSLPKHISLDRAEKKGFGGGNPERSAGDAKEKVVRRNARPLTLFSNSPKSLENKSLPRSVNKKTNSQLPKDVWRNDSMARARLVIGLRESAGTKRNSRPRYIDCNNLYSVIVRLPLARLFPIYTYRLPYAVHNVKGENKKKKDDKEMKTLPLFISNGFSISFLIFFFSSLRRWGRRRVTTFTGCLLLNR